MTKSCFKARGFTLIELILVIAVFSIIFSSASVVFGNMIGRNNLKYHGYLLVQNLREARMNSISHKNDSEWGIHFNDAVTPYGYTFFKGASFVTRDSDYDLDFEFPEIIGISQLNFGGTKEIVFHVSSGFPTTTGNLALATDNESYAVFINSAGLVDYSY